MMETYHLILIFFLGCIAGTVIFNPDTMEPEGEKHTDSRFVRCVQRFIEAIAVVVLGSICLLGESWVKARKGY